MYKSISSELFSLRNLHVGLSDFTQPPRSLARPRADKKIVVVEESETRERSKFGQVLGKYSGLFQRVLSAIGPYASTRKGMERVSFLQYVQVLSTVSRPGSGQSFVFLP